MGGGITYTLSTHLYSSIHFANQISVGTFILRIAGMQSSNLSFCHKISLAARSPG